MGRLFYRERQRMKEESVEGESGKSYPVLI